MKLLLDTHIWIWSVLEPRRLSRKVASVLGKSTNELWISPLSTWEILNLCQKRRFRADPTPLVWIEAARTRVPVREAALTHDVAVATAEISLPHSDPMDRLLAATARAYGLTLVTADQHLIAGKGFSVLANH